MTNRDNEKLSDDLLIKRFSEGYRTSFDLLIARYGGSIHSYIKMAVGDSYIADDLLQDTFIKVIDNISKGKYNDQGKFKSWLYRVAHNLVMDYFRRQKTRNIISLSENFEELSFLENLPSDVPTVEERLCQQNDRDMVQRWVELLPREQQEVLMLRYQDDLSFKEIAQKTGVSINTALGRMRYALINLRKHQGRSVA